MKTAQSVPKSILTDIAEILNVASREPIEAGATSRIPLAEFDSDLHASG